MNKKFILKEVALGDPDTLQALDESDGEWVKAWKKVSK
jgi:hypothetical protein